MIQPETSWEGPASVWEATLAGVPVAAVALGLAFIVALGPRRAYRPLLVLMIIAVLALSVYWSGFLSG